MRSSNNLFASSRAQELGFDVFDAGNLPPPAVQPEVAEMPDGTLRVTGPTRKDVVMLSQLLSPGFTPISDIERVPEWGRWTAFTRRLAPRHDLTHWFGFWRRSA